MRLQISWDCSQQITFSKSSIPPAACQLHGRPRTRSSSRRRYSWTSSENALRPTRIARSSRCRSGCGCSAAAAGDPAVAGSPDCRSASGAVTASGAGGDAAVIAAPFSAFNAAYSTAERHHAQMATWHRTPTTFSQPMRWQGCPGAIWPPCAVWTSVHSAGLSFRCGSRAGPHFFAA